jgi:cell wall assembly regulator SMI1
MQEIWERIEKWLLANAPELYDELSPGASEEELQRAETILGVRLPDEVRESYGIHNGQKHYRGVGFNTAEVELKLYGLLDNSTLMSLEAILGRWNMLKELREGGDFDDLECITDGSTVTDWWHPKWIPFTYNFQGDYDCIDLNPGEKGRQGQIIEFWHDYDKRFLIAGSFQEFMGRFAGELEAGEFVLSELYSLIRKE